NRESARDVYSRHRILVVTKLKIVEWHNYKHLDWITVRRNDDKLYKSKEGDYNRLRLQDIEDMLLLLVQGKLTNLNVEERLALGVSLRMFTRSIVLKRRMEDLQLGVESYQKKLNLTRPDMYKSDLKRKSAYTAHSNPRGFIYQNKDKKNRLMRIDELHKFSDVWRNVDKERAGAMIQAIDQQLRNRRIIRSLEKFVGGRPEHAEYDESNTYVLERFNTTAGNPVKEILLKLNLPDHRSILTDSKVTPTKLGRMTKSYSSPRSIANCFIAYSHKDGHGDSESELELLHGLRPLKNSLEDGASGANEFFSIEGEVGLLTWFESIESVLHITKCPIESHVKFGSSMLQGRTLTWWNILFQTRGRVVAIAQPWEDFKKLLMEEYCPDDEIQKLETEF
ncbi:hypothetical protein Tco_0757185, partial [Tanacetum coccineum]